MKRKKFEMEWFVYIHGLNRSGFRKMNIFNHFRFEECTKKHLKGCSTKEEFAERISRELFYYFGSKCEYELIITRKDNKITLSPWMGNKEDILDVTDDTDFDWNGFYEKMDQRYRKFEDSIKFDVNDQIKRLIDMSGLTSFVIISDTLQKGINEKNRLKGVKI